MKKKRDLIFIAIAAIILIAGIGVAYAEYSAVTDVRDNALNLVKGETGEEGVAYIEEPGWASASTADENHNGIKDVLELEPGDSVEKDPSLVSMAPYTAYAYIRAEIPTVAARLEGDSEDKVYDLVTLDTIGEGYAFIGTNEEWDLVEAKPSATAGKNTVITYRYKDLLSPTGTEGTNPYDSEKPAYQTTELFKKITVQPFISRTTEILSAVKVGGVLVQGVGIEVTEADAEALRLFNLETTGEIEASFNTNSATATFKNHGGTKITQQLSEATSVFMPDTMTNTNADAEMIEWSKNDATHYSFVDFPDYCTTDTDYYAIWANKDTGYQVQILKIDGYNGNAGDICIDKAGNEITAGMSFAPATGQTYADIHGRSHVLDGSVNAQGHVHRCINKDSWEQIIYWSKKDPLVYEKCLEHGCTRGIPVIVPGTMETSTKTLNQVYSVFDSNVSQFVTWNNIASTAGDYAASRIRAVLIGKTEYTDPAVAGDGILNFNEENALISGFPNVIKQAIVARKLTNEYTKDGKVYYDKLWELSREDVQQKQTTYKAYNRAGSAASWWLRAVRDTYNAFYVDTSGAVSYSGANSSCGLAPGFCLE